VHNYSVQPIYSSCLAWPHQTETNGEEVSVAYSVNYSSTHLEGMTKTTKTSAQSVSMMRYESSTSKISHKQYSEPTECSAIQVKSNLST
jgi:hypothetical protein